jgi:hypothetical protein
MKRDNLGQKLKKYYEKTEIRGLECVFSGRRKDV